MFLAIPVVTGCYMYVTGKRSVTIMLGILITHVSINLPLQAVFSKKFSWYVEIVAQDWRWLRPWLFLNISLCLTFIYIFIFRLLDFCA